VFDLERRCTEEEAYLLYDSNAGRDVEADAGLPEGSIIKGQILEVRPREVLVDVGYKSEGVIPLKRI
jgi:Ribosomal protein S1